MAIAGGGAQPVQLTTPASMFRRSKAPKGPLNRQFLPNRRRSTLRHRLPPSTAESSNAGWSPSSTSSACKGANALRQLHRHNADNCPPTLRREARQNMSCQNQRHLGPEAAEILIGRSTQIPVRVLEFHSKSEEALHRKTPAQIFAYHLCADAPAHLPIADVKTPTPGPLRGVLYRKTAPRVAPRLLTHAHHLRDHPHNTHTAARRRLAKRVLPGRPPAASTTVLFRTTRRPPTQRHPLRHRKDRLILSLQNVVRAKWQQGRDVYLAWMGEAYVRPIHASKGSAAKCRLASSSSPSSRKQQIRQTALGQAAI